MTNDGTEQITFSLTTSFLFVFMMFPALLIVSCYFVLFTQRTANSKQVNAKTNYILEMMENFDRKFTRGTRLLEGQKISTFSLHTAKGTGDQ